jgi:hypothetical protein
MMALESTRAMAREFALANEIYATVVSGDCMAPEVPSGSAVAVDPRATVRSGDLIIIVRKPEFIRAGDPPAVLKRLEGRLHRAQLARGPYPGEPRLRVSMFTPTCCFTILYSEIAAVHRCLGLVERSADGQHAHVPDDWFSSTRPAARLAGER